MQSGFAKGQRCVGSNFRRIGTSAGSYRLITMNVPEHSERSGIGIKHECRAVLARCRTGKRDAVIVTGGP